MNIKILNKPIAMAEITLILKRLCHSLHLFQKNTKQDDFTVFGVQGFSKLSRSIHAIFNCFREKKKGNSVPSSFYEASITLVPSKTSTVQEQKVIDKCHV